MLSSQKKKKSPKSSKQSQASVSAVVSDAPYPIAFFTVFMALDTFMKRVSEEALAQIREKFKLLEESSITLQALDAHKLLTIQSGSKTWPVLAIKLNVKARVIAIQDGKRCILLDYLPNHEYKRSSFMDPQYIRTHLIPLLGADDSEDVSIQPYADEAEDVDTVFCEQPESVMESKLTQIAPGSLQGMWMHNKQFVYLSDRQQAIYKAGGSGPVIVQGDPGTGKSMVATDALIQLAQRHKCPLLTAEDAGSFGGGDRPKSSVAYVSKGQIIVDRTQKCYQKQTALDPDRALFLVPLRDLYESTVYTLSQILSWIATHQRSYSALQHLSQENIFQELTCVFALKGDMKAYQKIRGAGCLSEDPLATLSHLVGIFKKFQSTVLDIYASVEGFQWPNHVIERFDSLIIDEAQNFTVPELLQLMAHSQTEDIFLMGDPKQTQFFCGTDTLHMLGPIYHHLFHKSIPVFHLQRQYRCQPAILEFANLGLNLTYHLLQGVPSKDEGLIQGAIDHEGDRGEVRWFSSQKSFTLMLPTLKSDNCEWAVITCDQHMAEAQKFFGKSALILTAKQAQGLDLKLVVLYRIIDAEALSMIGSKDFRHITNRISKGESFPRTIHRGVSPYSVLISFLGRLFTSTTRASHGVWMVELEEGRSCSQRQSLNQVLHKQEYERDAERPCPLHFGKSTLAEWIEYIQYFAVQKEWAVVHQLFKTHIQAQSAEDINFTEWCSDHGMDLPTPKMHQSIRLVAPDRPLLRGAASPVSMAEFSLESVEVSLAVRLQTYHDALLRNDRKILKRMGSPSAHQAHDIVFTPLKGQSIFDKLMDMSNLQAGLATLCSSVLHTHNIMEFLFRPCPSVLIGHLGDQEFFSDSSTFEALVCLAVDSTKYVEVLSKLLHLGQQKGKKGSVWSLFQDKMTARLQEFLHDRRTSYQSVAQWLPIAIPEAALSSDCALGTQEKPEDAVHCDPQCHDIPLKEWDKVDDPSWERSEAWPYVQKIQTVVQALSAATEVAYEKQQKIMKFSLKVAIQKSIHVPEILWKIRDLYQQYCTILAAHNVSVPDFSSEMIALYCDALISMHSSPEVSQILKELVRTAERTSESLPSLLEKNPRLLYAASCKTSVFFGNPEFIRVIIEDLKIPIHKIPGYQSSSLDRDSQKSHLSMLEYAILQADLKLLAIYLRNDLQNIALSQLSVSWATNFLCLVVADSHRHPQSIDMLLNILSMIRSSSTPDLYFNKSFKLLGGTALEIACIKHKYECAMYLLKYGANPFFSNPETQQSALAIVLQSSDNEILLKYLLDHPPNNNPEWHSQSFYVNTEKHYPLTMALRSGQKHNALELIRAGAQCLQVQPVLKMSAPVRAHELAPRDAGASDDVAMQTALYSTIPQDFAEEVIPVIFQSVQSQIERSPASKRKMLMQQWHREICNALILTMYQKTLRFSLVRMLVQRGLIALNIDLIMRNDSEDLVFFSMIRTLGYVDLLQLVLDHAKKMGTLIALFEHAKQCGRSTTGCGQGASLLMRAIKFNNAPAVQCLLDIGDDLFWVNPKDNMTAFSLSITLGHLNCLQHILDALATYPAHRQLMHLHYKVQCTQEMSGIEFLNHLSSMNAQEFIICDQEVASKKAQDNKMFASPIFSANERVDAYKAMKSLLDHRLQMLSKSLDAKETESSLPTSTALSLMVLPATPVIFSLPRDRASATADDRVSPCKKF